VLPPNYAFKRTGWTGRHLTQTSGRSVLRKRKHVTSGVGASLVIPCLHNASAADDSCEISAEIGGGLAHTATLTVRDGELKYLKGYLDASVPDPAPRNPSAVEWAAFRATLDEIEIWQWKLSYSIAPPDGAVESESAHWSVSIRCGDHAIVTSGTAAYPGDRALDMPSKQLTHDGAGCRALLRSWAAGASYLSGRPRAEHQNTVRARIPTPHSIRRPVTRLGRAWRQLRTRVTSVVEAVEKPHFLRAKRGC
jgi:hypothetical protein